MPVHSAPETIFRCPVCLRPLRLSTDRYACENLHSFDLAKSGYANFLLPNQRHSTDPGDSKAMVDSRDSFLEQGGFAPVAERLAALVCDEVVGPKIHNILDVGCGTGHYLRRIGMRLSERPSAASVVLHGIDISKHAVVVASKKNRTSRYAVASSFRMPVLDGAVDVLLAHFAQAPAPEIARVSRPGGLVIVGVPGPRHLFDLRRRIYSRPVEHETKAPFRDEPSLHMLSTSRVESPLVLTNPAAILSLFQMTPYYWSSNEDVKRDLSTLRALETQIDVVFHLYRKALETKSA